MDDMPNQDPMDRPDALGGLNPAGLLQQGAAEDTIFERSPSFTPPTLEEMARIFPQFEMLGMIGQGGMGAVYKVRQRALDRVAALKILPPAIGEQPGFSQSFTREAKSLAKLNHPGIVTLYEFGREQDLYYFLMEYVDGMNLRQLLQKERISPREAMAIVPQICDALQYAHDHGIVHRDIKPENLLLDRRGKVKVADFGIAKVVAAGVNESTAHLASGEASDFTIFGKVVGTPDYMAPEQIDHPGDVDHRADIYALGVVFYQMLTGELPGKKIEMPSQKIHVDVRLDEVVLRALEKSPEHRYQQADVFKTQVESIANSPGKKVPSQPINAEYIITHLWQVVPIVAVALAFINPWGSKAWMWFGAACAVLALLPGCVHSSVDMETSPGRWSLSVWIRIALVAFSLLLLGSAFVFWTDRNKEVKIVSHPVGDPVRKDENLTIASSPQQLAEKWLCGIDEGNYEISWDEAAASFHDAITKDAWKSALDTSRKSLGQLVSRQYLGQTESTTKSGSLQKSRVIMTFKAVYPDKICREIVTFSHEGNGNWRAAGYLIQDVRKKGPFSIRVFGSGEILVEGENFSLDSLKEKITALHRDEPEQAFLIAPDATCPADLVTKVMGILAEAGVTKVSFERNEDASSTTVFQQAERWLEVIDQDNYLRSWDETAEHFRKLVPRENWHSMMNAVRHPLGKRVARQFEKEQEVKSLPGGPEGEYLIMTFKAQFEHMKATTETVTAYKEKDGKWRVCGYYIKADAAFVPAAPNSSTGY